MGRARPRARAGAWAAAVLGMLLVGCTEKNPCDEGQVVRNGYCYIVDASVVARDATVGEPGAAFGQACATSADCPSPTSFCAPWQGGNFCTVFGCDQDPTLCPSTWTCMDLASYGMAAHLCVPSQ